MSTRIYTALGVLGALAFAAVLTMSQAFGHDDEPLGPDTDAQRAAQRQAAEDRCAALYGSAAMFFETKQGHLVCRNGKLK